MVTTSAGAGIPRNCRRGPGAIRAVWLSPLMRPLARVQAEALRARGVDVLLVTTDRHPESDMARDYEMVLDLRFRTVATWIAAWRRIRDFQPDVVITEQVRDPRWTALARGIRGFSWSMTIGGTTAAGDAEQSCAPCSTVGDRARRPP